MSACWAGDLPELPEGPVPWSPIGAEVAGYEVERIETPLSCPDGLANTLVVVRPIEPAAPVPTAVLLHEGAFDYVLAPTPEMPLAGPSWRSPRRLDASWSVRRAWAVAGLWTTDDPVISHAGALPIALAEAGYAVLIPANCWGDLGVNNADNAATDGFVRQGAAANALAWRLSTQAGFADEQGISLGFEPDPARALLAASGQSGRGAAVLLHDASFARPDALILDSVEDDLDTYWQDPAAWSDVIAGLERIWPGGRAAASVRRVANAPRPLRTALVLSAADPAIPAGTIDELAIAVQGAGGRVVDTSLLQHIQLGADLPLAREIVGWATTPPAP